MWSQHDYFTAQTCLISMLPVFERIPATTNERSRLGSEQSSNRLMDVPAHKHGRECKLIVLRANRKNEEEEQLVALFTQILLKVFVAVDRTQSRTLINLSVYLLKSHLIT